MYLNCKSYYSYRYGTFSTEQLVQYAAATRVKTLALTNINNTADVWSFVALCKENDIQPVVGVEIRNGQDFCYILLAASNAGFGAINRYMSGILCDKKKFPTRAPQLPDVHVIYRFGRRSAEQMAPHEYIGVQTTEVNALFTKYDARHPDRYVVLQPVTFLNDTYYNVHRFLRCSELNVLGAKLPASAVAGRHETFAPIADIEKAFERYPHILENTRQLLARCSIQMDFGTDKTKQCFSASKEDDRVLLAKLAGDGLLYRYGRSHSAARQRVESELKVIDQMGFNAYFLMAHDVIRYAAMRGFYHVGRGSGANSITSFCLKITDVDPLELDLYFERFLNHQRTSPPDFDIDFSHRDRDEVIDYIFKRYGKDHVVLLGMHTTFQFKAAVRELGKIYGLPAAEIDMLSEGRGSRNDPIHRQIDKYASLIKDFPKDHSIHPGGMLISEKPIYEYTSVTIPPKGFVTAHIDMFVAEDIGLYKLDILSQRGLGHIREAVELVKQYHGIDIDIHNVKAFKQDPRINENLRHGLATGCFYIESPSMRQVLRKLGCSDYRTLVAASSIIRPGVGSSGMMGQYIFRHRHPDRFTYLHPVLEQHLSETYGVMIYQEDVIRVAHFYAGLDLADADVLRRAMSGKVRGTKQMEKVQQNFFAKAKELGRAEDITAELWRQMASFAGYSFSKAHSASYAVESYQSLVLKTYYPVEFMIAVINNWGGFYTRMLYFHELKKAGATLLPPCVNHSLITTGMAGGAVYVGLEHIHSLQKDLADRIVTNRMQLGDYRSLQDFIDRVRPPLEQLNTLIKVGALRFTGKQSKGLLWEANFLQTHHDRHAVAALTMFDEPDVDFALPDLPTTTLEQMYQEIDLLGFTTGDIFELLDEDASQYVAAKDLPTLMKRQVVTIGFLVTTKGTVTKKGPQQPMFFGTFLDKNGDWIDTVHFPQSAREYPIEGQGFYRIYGEVIEEFEVVSISVVKVEKVGIKSRR